MFNANKDVRDANNIRRVAFQVFADKSENVWSNMKKTEFITDALETLNTYDIGAVSDGYHTYDELYDHRAVLFSVICNIFPEKAWKSLQHDDPNQPMYDGMFIVGIETPMGQATYHFDVGPYWDMFDVKVLERAPKWDGHTPAQAIERIASLSHGAHYRTFTNEFTKECDKHLLDELKKNHEEYDLVTEFYIGRSRAEHLVSNSPSVLRVDFRYPGATRGFVELDATTGRVLLIEFNDTAFANDGVACYKQDILVVRGKYMGYPMLDLLAALPKV